MAVYKVPQDVEAEDKLIGWLSFRQFVYLMIAVSAAVVGFFLIRVSFFLIIIPLPIILLFGTLALPIRKDQPLETYLLAVIRFYLKPKTRRWDPDGVASYVDIIAPAHAEHRLAKEYSADTAQERLDYVARIMDSRGWAYKNTAAPTEISINPTIAAEANNAVDVLDDHADLSQSLQGLIDRKDQERRQTAIERMQGGAQPSQATMGGPTPSTPPTNSTWAQDNPTTPAPIFNPYPSSMHQKVILPPGQQPVTPIATAPSPTQPITSMTPPMSPDIIRLASNNDLSVSAIAHEAQRLEAKENEEVIIQLH